MKLSPSQQQQLLMLRQSHLAKMRNIYEERQRLNLEVGRRREITQPGCRHADSKRESLAWQQRVEPLPLHLP